MSDLSPKLKQLLTFANGLEHILAILDSSRHERLVQEGVIIQGMVDSFKQNLREAKTLWAKQDIMALHDKFRKLHMAYHLQQMQKEQAHLLLKMAALPMLPDMSPAECTVWVAKHQTLALLIHTAQQVHDLLPG